MLAGGTEGGAGNRADAGLFEQDAADFFGAGAGAANIDPGIESAFGATQRNPGTRLIS